MPSPKTNAAPPPARGEEAAPALGRLLLGGSGHHAGRLFHDREAHARLVAILLGNFTPAVLGLFAALERTFDLRRAFHELVEIHRAELTADHPEIAAFAHCQSPVSRA